MNLLKPVLQVKGIVILILSVFVGILFGADQTVRVGIIGLDTSHSIAFTRVINSPDSGPEFEGFEVVGAYPKGSPDIESSVSRVPKYIEQIQEMDVKIYNSIAELLENVDVILLETNDGRPHLQQAQKVIEAGKPLFVDKPVAASLVETIKIYDLAQQHEVPMFSASSLRYYENAEAIHNGEAGEVIGANTWSPAPTEVTHPSLYWYGIHGVEMLIVTMGTGCETVMSASTDGADVITGIWEDGRIGSFRGIREGKTGYGGTVFGTDQVLDMGGYNGYEPLVAEIMEFFRTGVAPMEPEETLEIYAFMTAADESKKMGGLPVDLQSVLDEAKRKAAELPE